jgi:adenylyltransferase/sulfurtransferase
MPDMLEITPEAVKAKLDAGEPLHLIDVREAHEVAICSIAGAEHVPMMSLFLGIKTTTATADTPIVVICHHGIRSLEATQFLRMQGFEQVQSMAGGVEAWAQRVDPEMARY